MRVLCFERPGVAGWREHPPPQLLTGLGAIVKPLVVGRCDLDVAFMRGRFPIQPGSMLGHECIAEVIDTGALVRSVQPGSRVLVSAQICCGVCGPCRRGHTGRCEAVPFGASVGMGRAGDFGGALAEFMRVPYADAMLVPFPSALDPVAMVGAADMALDSWRAIAPPLRERPQARVLVVGGEAAVIALYAVGLAIALGAGEVVYWDDEENRARLARALGAVVGRSDDGADGAFDIVVDGGGDPVVLQRALNAAAPEAVFTSVAIYLDPLTSLPLRQMYVRGITFHTGRPNVRPPMEHVIGLCNSGHFRPDEVPNTVFAFDDAAQAWCSDALRTVVSRI